MTRPVGIGWVLAALLLHGTAARGDYPVLVTAKTRANPTALAELEKPGKVVFSAWIRSQDFNDLARAHLSYGLFRL